MRIVKGICLFALTILVMGCSKENLKEKFSGTWLRSDGGYSFEISVDENNTATARYFNPKPIKVKAAVFKENEKGPILHIVFDDVNYQGSYYMLSHDTEKDILHGNYFQAAAAQYYPVSFNRK